MGRVQKWHCNSKLPLGQMCAKCARKVRKGNRARAATYREENRESWRVYNTKKQREYRAKKRGE